LPTSKSAEKKVRVAQKKRIRNKPVRTLCKSSITKAEKLIADGEVEAAEKAVTEAISALDKAAVKGVIHANNAARRKSRLTSKLNAALASDQAKPEVEAQSEEAEPAEE
jgi:small subunit ribosomal protein S20